MCIRDSVSGAQYLIPGAGPLARLVHLSGDERAGHRADGGVHQSFAGLGYAVAHCQVDPAEGGGVELKLQPLLSMGVLGHYYQAGRAPVQPVDQVDIRQKAGLSVVPGDMVAQRIVKMAGARVDRQAGSCLLYTSRCV